MIRKIIRIIKQTTVSKNFILYFILLVISQNSCCCYCNNEEERHYYVSYRSRLLDSLKAYVNQPSNGYQVDCRFFFLKLFSGAEKVERRVLFNLLQPWGAILNLDQLTASVCLWGIQVPVFWQLKRYNTVLSVLCRTPNGDGTSLFESLTNKGCKVDWKIGMER